MGTTTTITDNECYFPDHRDPLGQKHVLLKYRELNAEYVAMCHLLRALPGTELKDLAERLRWIANGLAPQR